MKKLVIVESPTKAKTITRFLDKSYQVESSFGHIRDLPKKEMGIDLESFLPQYIIPEKAKKQVLKLKKLAKSAKVIYLATDADREGEAISWHLIEALKIPQAKIKRIVFHEITKSAILEALKNPTELNLNLVNAQQARRCLDRLVGYELSPFLWQKIARGLSAGRVQSTAVRLIVEKEAEIKKFISQEYWDLSGTFQTEDNHQNTTPIEAKLHSFQSKKLTKFAIDNEKEALRIKEILTTNPYKIQAKTIKKQTKTPPPPYTTSTLQQDGNRKLNLSAKQTMYLAQKLYEGIKIQQGTVGLITYMRTDSLNMSPKFLNSCQKYLIKNLGAEYALDKPRFYKTKNKTDQEAHEAIRPTDIENTPQAIKPFVENKMYQLYKLIWEKALASQMAPASLEKTSLDLGHDSNQYTFRIQGSLILFPGYLKVTSHSLKENLLPPLKEGDLLQLKTLTPNQHFTEPPARYSDASLVKVLEEYGIGRPSTYAPTISTIIDRGYVERIENRRLQPTSIAKVVTELLTNHFSKIIDYKFTANLEDKFDQIAETGITWTKILADFYQPFKENLETKKKSLDRKDILKDRLIDTDPKSGLPVWAKNGYFGPYVQLGEWSEEDRKAKINQPRRASLLKTQDPETITLSEAMELLILPRTIGQDKDGHDIIANEGRYGPYLKSNKTNLSLPAEYNPRTIDLKTALDLFKNQAKLKKERAKPIAELGEDPNSKQPILIKNGIYGPHISDGKTNVSIPKKTDPTTITREEAIELLEKKRKAPPRKKRTNFKKRKAKK